MAETQRQDRPTPVAMSLARLVPERAGVASPLPLSVYVHLPWCLSKCPYCDFNSHPVAAASGGGAAARAQAAAGHAVASTTRALLPLADEHRYLDALQAELEQALPQVWGRTIGTVFIGGGTPSLFSPEGIDRLIASLRAHLQLVPGAEITMEANPGTFEAGRFRGYAQAGVTRLSIGVQSFDDAMLRALGRVHDGQQARSAVELAAQCFESFNIDLMYALPGQSLPMLETDLATALALEPPHLSCYQLSLEPGTPFARKPPVLPDDDLAFRMHQVVGERCAQHGLSHYEVSAWARDGHRCRHNLNYWQFGDYLGLGAGAHGKLSYPDRIVRHERLRQPRAWMNAALQGHETGPEVAVAAADLPFEFMLNALRLQEGVRASLFQERTGLALTRISATLSRAVERGLLDPDPLSIKAAPQGQIYLNDLLELFLPQPTSGKPAPPDGRLHAPSATHPGA